MPSLATRTRYQGIVLQQAEAALENTSALLIDLQDGELDVEAITVGGQRFINDGGTLVVEP